MQYTRVKFTCNPSSEAVTDVLAAMLAEIGFDAFMEAESVMEAYIPTDMLSVDKIDAVLTEFPMEVNITYAMEQMEEKNWNEEWEKNYFQPISITEELLVYSSFHRPEGSYRYRIVIDPKMSFGTGHHETTRLMLEELLAMNLTGKKVLDMGCGTAVLAILASMKGASPVTAIDIDEWAYRNALENVQLNKIPNIRVEQGGAELLDGEETYDLVLANINRNVLLDDMGAYARVLNKGGYLVISGFYQEDIPLLRDKAEEVGLIYQHMAHKQEWAAVSFCRK